MVELTRHEQAWIDARRRETEQASHDDGPGRSLRGRTHRAADRWAIEAGWVAVGLTRATVTLPPSSRPGDGTSRRAAGPSDPTGAVLHATYDTVAREAEAFAHLAGPCLRDGTTDPDTRRVHECPTVTATHLADYAGVTVDASDVVDGLLGTPTSSPAAFAAAVSRGAAWHAATSVQLLEAWQEAWRAGAEPSVLETWTTRTEHLTRLMAALAGRLADWSGRRERRCRACDGAAPSDRATCGRCRTASWRARAESA